MVWSAAASASLNGPTTRSVGGAASGLAFVAGGDAGTRSEHAAPARITDSATAMPGAPRNTTRFRTGGKVDRVDGIETRSFITTFVEGRVLLVERIDANADVRVEVARIPSIANRPRGRGHDDVGMGQHVIAGHADGELAVEKVFRLELRP